MSNDPGAAGTLPYAGLQTYTGFDLGIPSARFSIGLKQFAETELGRLSKTYTYTESGWFSDQYSRTVTQRIGVVRAGVSLSIGGTFEL